MQITIRHTEGCPNLAQAEERVRKALRASGNAEVSVARELVRTADDAERLGFIGSPTILIDGVDPFAEESRSPALACRLYRSGDVTEGAPPERDLERAIRERSGA